MWEDVTGELDPFYAFKYKKVSSSVAVHILKNHFRQNFREQIKLAITK